MGRLLVLLLLASCSQIPEPGPPPMGEPEPLEEVPELLRAPLPRELTVVRRGDWDPAPVVSGVRYPGKLANVVRTVVVHHSDFPDAPGPLVIKGYHLEVSGFSDIGYHFVIGPDGTVYEGRPLDRMGAHAGATREAARGLGKDRDPDWGSIGICLDGNFEADAPPEAQLHALQLLIDDLRARFPRIERVIGHREVKAELVDARGLTMLSHETTCPGSALYRFIENSRIRGGFSGKPQALVKLQGKPESAVITVLEPANITGRITRAALAR